MNQQTIDQLREYTSEHPDSPEGYLVLSDTYEEAGFRYEAEFLRLQWTTTYNVLLSLNRILNDDFVDPALSEEVISHNVEVCRRIRATMCLDALQKMFRAADVLRNTFWVRQQEERREDQEASTAIKDASGKIDAFLRDKCAAVDAKLCLYPSMAVTGISVRARKTVNRLGIHEAWQLAGVTRAEVLDTRNCGVITTRELEDMAGRLGLQLSDELDMLK